MQHGHTDPYAVINYLHAEQHGNHKQEMLLWLLDTPEEIQPFTFPYCVLMMFLWGAVKTVTEGWVCKRHLTVI